MRNLTISDSSLRKIAQSLSTQDSLESIVDSIFSTTFNSIEDVVSMFDRVNNMYQENNMGADKKSEMLLNGAASKLSRFIENMEPSDAEQYDIQGFKASRSNLLIEFFSSLLALLREPSNYASYVNFDIDSILSFGVTEGENAPNVPEENF